MGVGDGQGSLVCWSPWGCKESDMTEQLNWTEGARPSFPEEGETRLEGSVCMGRIQKARKEEGQPSWLRQWCVCVAGASLLAQMVRNLPAVQKTQFDPWVGKIPWRRKWQSTPEFLPGKSHGQRSLEGSSVRVYVDGSKNTKHAFAIFRSTWHHSG